MANPQIKELVEYIKKARDAGQQDPQTRQILNKNGWSDQEIDEAFGVLQLSSAKSPVQTNVDNFQIKPQTPIQPEVKSQPPAQELNYQPQAPAEQFQPKADFQPKPMAQPMEMNMQESGNRKTREGGSHFVLKFLGTLLTIFLILAVVGGVGYFVVTQTGLLNNLPKELLFLNFTQPEIVQPINNTDQTSQNQNNVNQNTIAEMTTKNLSVVPQEYDATKVIVAAFGYLGDKTVYCASLKADARKTTCFQNNQKLFDVPYTYKPYWIGISPDEKRIVLLFYDSSKKQSFAFENGQEFSRYDGTINYPVFSQDSKNFMFMVQGLNGKNYVVLNNSPFTSHDKIFTIPEFSPDGKYVLYGARDGQNIIWAVDKVNPQTTPSETQETEQLSPQ